MVKRFDSKTVIVTGATGGLGKACVARLLEEGAQVVAADLSSTAPEDNAALFEAENLIYHACDVTDRASVQTLVAAGTDHFGQIHGLVTYAGTARFAPAHEITDADWELQFDINARGTLLCIQAVLPQMIEAQYGRLVTVSSMLGVTTGPNRSAYAASKGAVQALTRQIAMEYGKSGITTNSLAPGPVRTPLWLRENGTDPETQAKFKENIPTKHFGTPEDIAAAAAFLVSDDAAYVNGHTLLVDGGISVRGLSLS